jgi:hypothetical protein
MAHRRETIHVGWLAESHYWKRRDSQLGAERGARSGHLAQSHGVITFGSSLVSENQVRGMRNAMQKAKPRVNLSFLLG